MRPAMIPATLLDIRVPQPGRETDDYGVPAYVVEAAAVLYRHRNVLRGEAIYIIDDAIMRLYGPWIRPARE